MKKIICIFLCIVSLASLFSGCKKKDSETNNNDKTEDIKTMELSEFSRDKYKTTLLTFKKIKIGTEKVNNTEQDIVLDAYTEYPVISYTENENGSEEAIIEYKNKEYTVNNTSRNDTFCICKQLYKCVASKTIKCSEKPGETETKKILRRSTFFIEFYNNEYAKILTATNEVYWVNIKEINLLSNNLFETHTVDGLPRSMFVYHSEYMEQYGSSLTGYKTIVRSINSFLNF